MPACLVPRPGRLASLPAYSWQAVFKSNFFWKMGSVMTCILPAVDMSHLKRPAIFASPIQISDSNAYLE